MTSSRHLRTKPTRETGYEGEQSAGRPSYALDSRREESLSERSRYGIGSPVVIRGRDEHFLVPVSFWLDFSSKKGKRIGVGGFNIPPVKFHAC